MISSYDIKRAYIKLYYELSQYLWDYNFVSLLVEFESCTLKRFPNMQQVRNTFNKLYATAHDVIRDDEDLANAFNEFKATIENNDCEYACVTVNVAQ